MTTYYRHDDLEITDAGVRKGNQRYSLDEITDVWVQPPFRYAALIRRISLFLAGAAGVVGGGFGLWFFVSGGWHRAGLGTGREFVIAYLAFVAFTIGFVVLGRFLDPAPGRADLWISRGTVSIRLASRLDAVEMGKARRALHRARQRRTEEQQFPEG